MKTLSLQKQLVLLLTTICISLAMCHSGLHHNRTARAVSTSGTISICNRHILNVTVPYQGCQPSYTNIAVCGGACRSHTLQKVSFPFSVQDCSCCAPTYYRVKVRKIWFTCGSKRERKRVFLPNVRSCGCVRCDGSL